MFNTLRIAIYLPQMAKIARERTQEEFTALLDEAGFAIAATLPLPDTQNLIEAVPSRSA